MKKIIINGKFMSQRITGVQRYAYEILAELDKLIEPNSIEIAIPVNALMIPKYKNIQVKIIGKTRGILWEQFSFPFYVIKNSGISLNLCNVSPLVSPGIVCIHDVKIKACPQYFSKKFIIWYNLLFQNETKRAKKLITVSNFSKKEICKYYKINPNKIEVISDAWQHFQRIQYNENTLEKYSLVKNQYFFSMCSLEPNKNFKWIAEVARRNTEQIFAVSGSINKKVFADGLGFECPANMKLLGYVSDEEAKTLMRDCKAFLFPTFYEGFGIPPLEAMSVGATVISSNSTSLPEVLGDSVQYIDPQNYEIELDLLLAEQPEKGKDALNKYSWSKSAYKLKQLLSEI